MSCTSSTCAFVTAVTVVLLMSTPLASSFSTSVAQVVCNDTFAPISDDRCNQSSSFCATTSLPLHVCLNSTVFNVSVKVLDCYTHNAHHYPPSIVVAVYEGTELCEGVPPKMQYQPTGVCIPVGDNEFVENTCTTSPSSTPTTVAPSTESGKYFFLGGRAFSAEPEDTHSLSK